MQCKTRGVIAQSKTHRCSCKDKQGYFLLASESSTGAWGIHWVLCINAELQQSGMQCKTRGVIAQSKTHRFSCKDKQGYFLLASESSTGAWGIHWVLCINAELQQSGMQCKTRGVIAQSKTHRCNCTVQNP